MTAQEWKNDWRCRGQEEYLYGVTLRHLEYRPRSENWAHEHCEFCWARISADIPEDFHIAYATEDLDNWICPDCVKDLKELFGWTIQED